MDGWNDGLNPMDGVRHPTLLAHPSCWGEQWQRIQKVFHVFLVLVVFCVWVVICIRYLSGASVCLWCLVLVWSRRGVSSELDDGLETDGLAFGGNGKWIGDKLPGTDRVVLGLGLGFVSITLYGLYR
jgi:hypothetical protein